MEGVPERLVLFSVQICSFSAPSIINLGNTCEVYLKFQFSKYEDLQIAFLPKKVFLQCFTSKAAILPKVKQLFSKIPSVVAPKCCTCHSSTLLQINGKGVILTKNLLHFYLLFQTSWNLFDVFFIMHKLICYLYHFEASLLYLQSCKITIYFKGFWSILLVRYVFTRRIVLKDILPVALKAAK